MKKSLVAATALLVVLPVSLVLGRGTGSLPGESGVPINLNTGFPGCGACHNPFPDFNVTYQVTSAMSVRPGAAVPITAKTFGANSTSTRGGFSMEATLGTFVPGTTTRVGTLKNLRSGITHNSSLNRQWTFSLTAPTKPGLVKLFGTGNCADGNGHSSGDAWGWHGHDGSVPGTPHRIFVNATQIFPYGSSCAGEKGYLPVIGMPANAVINTSFDTQVHNVPPLTVSLVMMGFSNKLWGAFPLPFDLTALGAPGCSLRASMDVLNPIVTTGSGPSNGVGKATWALPNIPVLRGFDLYFQAMTVDASANALGLSLSMGLRAPIQ
ncbi:MAG: hypothetical protein CMJ85_11210 [Planctomycetes bacterium]|jgi:hypothetical protein|nr:hypothetical protein [Planctomycetota bacterium]MDP6425344.1 hypothetical protein [Planctomycetota bacterium]